MSGDEQVRLPEEEIVRLLGCLCEVFNEENRLLFVGRLQRYDRAEPMLCVEVQKRESTPRGVLYHAPVKVRLRERGQVVMFYGLVERNAADFWWLALQNMITTPERRESFRQQVRAAGTLTDGQGRQLPCQVVDVSLGGVQIRCQARYQEGEQLTLTFQLLENGPQHQVLCAVRRTVNAEEEHSMPGYGCSFQRLRPWQEDQLCRDIFALQKNSFRPK